MASPMIGAAAGDARELQVGAQMARMDSALEDANSAAMRLCERLQVVSRASPPTAAQGTAKVAEALAPLAEHIRGQVEKLQSVTHLLQDMCSRLEV